MSWRGGLIALLLLALQGCSALKLGYNQAPTLGQWWLDSLLALEAPQSAQTRDALQQWQRWHRSQELPTYADLLERLQVLALKDVDAAQVCEVGAQAQEALDRLMTQGARWAAPVAVQLQPRQLRHLARHMEEKNEEWEKEWLSGSREERLRRRLDKTASRYSDFYGPLSDAQLELLRNQLNASAWSAEWGRQDRLRRQALLLQALQRIQQDNLSPAQAEALLQMAWRQWLTPPAPAERQLYARLTEQACRHLAELHNSNSAEQRQRAVRRLKAYARDLRELAAQP
jgi:hypothetical protein